MTALLAIRGPLPRQAVTAALWPGTPAAAALANLRTAVFRLSQDHPGLVDTDGTALRLSAAADTDLHRIRALIRDLNTGSRAPNAPQIDALYRADLLPGWYEDWVLFEQERLLRDRIRTLEHAAERCVGAGDLQRAIVAADCAASLEPLREAPRRIIISALLAAGHRAEAARRAEAFHHLLRTELGTTPLPRTHRPAQPNPITGAQPLTGPQEQHTNDPGHPPSRR